MKRKTQTSQRRIAARCKDLRRILEALEGAGALLESAARKALTIERKHNGDPVTTAEHAVNQFLFRRLVGKGEGWLSEETRDDRERLSKSRVWIVDPVDGTKEFISGIPEWCVSIGLVEEGKAVAGGIYNPATKELFLGSLETNLTAGGNRGAKRAARNGAVVLASRSEVGRGEWKRFGDAPFKIRPVGSVAYKLALVAAGHAEATWTLVPKNEWDVAAGVALVLAAEGSVWTPSGAPLLFNRPHPLFDGLVAASKRGKRRLRGLLPGVAVWANPSTPKARTPSTRAK